jgi:hypothetical protein
MGGIGPSRKTRNVFVFSDAATGAQHGYHDDWMADGCFTTPAKANSVIKR